MTTTNTDDDVRIDTGTLIAAVWSRALRVVIVTVILLVLTFVMLMFVPKLYESSANILVEQRDSTFLRAIGGGVSGGVADDTSIASEIELIKSRDTLLYVIEKENLTAESEFAGGSVSPIGMIFQVFGMGGNSGNVNIQERVLANVADNLTVVRERDSRIISILFRAQNPQLAARVANAIADAHIARRAGLVISDTADATRWLKVEIDKMRTRVAEAEGQVAAYRVENDLFTNGENNSLLDQQLSDIATQISSAQERKSTAQSRALVLRGLIKAGQPIEGVPAVRDSPTITQLIIEKGRLQSERALRLSTLLPNHPDVKALSSQISQIDRQVVIEGRRVAEALDAEADVEADLERSLRSELARLKVDASGATTSTVALNELEREAKAQRDLLETYLLRFRDASARTDSNSALPDVRVVSLAAPSLSPASPKTALIMVAVLIMSIAGQVGYILFAELISGRSLVEIDADHARRRRNRSRSHWDDEPTDDYDDAHEFEPKSRPRPPRVERNPYGETRARRPIVEPQWSQRPAWENPLKKMRARAVERQAQADQQAFMQQQAYWQAMNQQQAWSQNQMPGNPQDPYAQQAPQAPYAQQAPQDPSGFSGPAPVRSQQSSMPADMVALAAAIAAGRERIVFISTLGDLNESDSAIAYLTQNALSRGLSVVVVDGASGEQGDVPGLSDLCAGDASFGDIVHRGRRSNTAEVPWGRHQRLDHRSFSAVTLAEALADIYEVVLISTGRPGIASSLPLFAGVDGLVLVASPFEIDEETLQGIEDDAASLEFNRVQLVNLEGVSIQVA